MHVRVAGRAVGPPRQSGTPLVVRVSAWTIRRQERLSCAGVLDGDMFLLFRRGGPAPQTRRTFGVRVCSTSVELLAHLALISLGPIRSHLGLLPGRPGCALRRILSGSKELLTRGSLRQNPLPWARRCSGSSPTPSTTSGIFQASTGSLPRSSTVGPPLSRPRKSRPCDGPTSSSARCRSCAVALSAVLLRHWRALRRR